MPKNTLSSIVIPSIQESDEFDTSMLMHKHEYTNVIIELAQEIYNNNPPRIDISSMDEKSRSDPILIAIETLKQMSQGLIDPIDDIIVPRTLPNGKTEYIAMHRLMNPHDFMYKYVRYIPSRLEYLHNSVIEPYTQEIDDVIATENDNYRSLNY